MTTFQRESQIYAGLARYTPRNIIYHGCKNCIIYFESWPSKRLKLLLYSCYDILTTASNICIARYPRFGLLRIVFWSKLKLCSMHKFACFVGVKNTYTLNTQKKIKKYTHFQHITINFMGVILELIVKKSNVFNNLTIMIDSRYKISFIDSIYKLNQIF
jgi:hypothetical protein